MTASEMAVSNSGPPSADAMIQRITNQDARSEGTAAAVVFATPHTIASIGNSGRTPSSRPPMEIGTW